MTRKTENRAKNKTGVSKYGVAIAVAFVLIVVIYFLFFSAGNQTPQMVLESQALPDRGDPRLLQAVESFPEEGRTHVGQDTLVEYKTSPPTSGNHFNSPAGAGFYSAAVPYGNLVHTLEHGGAVIYYDPAKLTEEMAEGLKSFVREHDDQWASVVALPLEEPGLNETVILTAWTKRLRLTEYNAGIIRAFLAEYLGRGPENKVR